MHSYRITVLIPWGRSIGGLLQVFVVHGIEYAGDECETQVSDKPKVTDIHELWSR